MRRCLETCRADGWYLEFGVAKGYSLRTLRQLIPKDVVIYGFDSFKGLPEDWHPRCPRGAFAADPAAIRTIPNVTLVEGMFADTLPGFVAEHKQQHVSFANIDCDLYSSTRTVLENLLPLVVVGTTFHFDEYFGYQGWEQHEYRAFQEFVEASGCEYIYLGRDDRYRVGIQITAMGAQHGLGR